ncbi:MAG TPA: hypothetical protein VHG29_07630 [Novosphingobium sp.]|nr:hypothetical protein [Novosphingobium sp.]
MKRIALLAALAVVSACSKPAPAPETDASAAAEASAPVAENIAADGKSSVGQFKVTASDGKVFIEDDKADGTYVETSDGKVLETGKWVQRAPGTFCYTKDEPDAKEICNEEKVENGVWTSKNPKGKVATIERVGG